MLGSIKANTVDRYLQPVRNQIADMVESDVDVVEYGCGNGDLLFKLSNKINSGIGVDNTVSLISYAQRHKENKGIKNINFKLLDLRNETPGKNVDYSIASLFFHVIPWEKSIELLKEMIKTSKKTIICGFSEPENWKQVFLLWMDQRFSGHYSCYKNYRKKNCMEGLLNLMTDIDYTCYDTFDPVIKIYYITKRNNTA